MKKFAKRIIVRLVRRLAVLHRLTTDQSGGVLLLVAIAIVPLTGFIGVGTDAARGYLVRSRFSSALDAATLAGGRNFSLATRDDDLGHQAVAALRALALVLSWRLPSSPPTARRRTGKTAG